MCIFYFIGSVVKKERRKKKRIQKQAVLTLLTDSNLKNLNAFFCDDAIPLHDFEFWKKIVSLLAKDFFSRSFNRCKFFHKNMSCVKNGTERQFDQIKYVFKIWLSRSKKSSIVDVWLGSKYASVNITLQGFMWRMIKS